VTRGDDALMLPCPGREKLGDGTVGATALHVAENYRRIAEFLHATVNGQDAHGAGDHGHHADHGRELRGRDARADDLRDRLSAALEGLALLAALSDDQPQCGASSKPDEVL
jgi:hypothetical protein